MPWAAAIELIWSLYVTKNIRNHFFYQNFSNSRSWFKIYRVCELILWISSIKNYLENRKSTQIYVYCIEINLFYIMHFSHVNLVSIFIISLSIFSLYSICNLSFLFLFFFPFSFLIFIFIFSSIFNFDFTISIFWFWFLVKKFWVWIHNQDSVQPFRFWFTAFKKRNNLQVCI